MLRRVVESSSLRSIGYDKRTRALEVEFLSGAVYSYAEVPPELWQALRDASSKGKFFQERIRDRFAFERA
jgi:KTSC domain